MPSPENRAVIAVAGAAKTQFVIDEALADPSRRVLITTFTNENLCQIRRRIEREVGVVPDHVHLASWFTFLLQDGARPYQYGVLADIGVVRGLNFDAKRQRFAKKTERRYFVDRNGDVLRDGLADFVCTANTNSGGAVVSRLEALYDDVYIDEMQDLVGYDLDVLDLLLASRIAVTMVGDPRQHTLSTSQVNRNKKYRGAGVHQWLTERSHTCVTEHRTRSQRCNQAICDFASALFPDQPPLGASARDPVVHEGIHRITRVDVHAYYATHRPMVLRDRQTQDTVGLPAMNIGVSKGGTFEHVLIFPTHPMLGYLADGDPSKLKAPERFYVAVTRARHSVAFVVPS